VFTELTRIESVVLTNGDVRKSPNHNSYIK